MNSIGNLLWLILGGILERIIEKVDTKNAAAQILG